MHQVNRNPSPFDTLGAQVEDLAFRLGKAADMHQEMRIWHEHIETLDAVILRQNEYISRMQKQVDNLETGMRNWEKAMLGMMETIQKLVTEKLCA